MATFDQTALCTAFRKLHESGTFVLPNPWDIGTARYLRHLGFKALATTSSGFAFSRGLPDAAWEVPRDAMLEHITEIAASAGLPVNADFESGYADEPAPLVENVRLCIATGVAGLSIEDATGERDRPLYDFPLAVERIRAARRAIDESGSGVVLTARAECYLVGHAEPLKESIRRLQAYGEAGADVLYAPGLLAPAEIRTLLDAVSPKPINVLMHSNTGLTVGDLTDLGVRRISVGSSLARAAWTGFIRAAEGIAKDGQFTGFDGMVGFTQLNEFFDEDLHVRRS